MRKIVSLFPMLMLFCMLAMAQTRTVTGTVKDEKGDPVPFATVTEVGTANAAQADANGLFTINVPNNARLIVSATGHQSQTLAVTGNVLNFTLATGQGQLQEVVVTALGIRRTRNQVPYAAQQVTGEEVSKERTSNFIQNLSGKVSGLEIRQTNTLGGSTNVVLRGVKSITGTNQALFVVDGVPFDNANTNSANQRTGRGGYDYGNAAADINPDDIESITVLKGPAASALYGSRGFNGVILITTKKGARGLGITVNSGITVGRYDKNTFAKYQNQYGGGYGAYYEDSTGRFLYRDPNTGFSAAYQTDANGNIIGWPSNGRLVVPTYEDASYGGAFDPNKQVYQWDAFDPTSINYGKPRPWVAAANGPAYIFQTAVSSNQSVFVNGGTDKGSFKVGYTRNDDKGIMPNSKITKNLVNFGSTLNITDKLTAGTTLNFSNLEGKGRYGTGYNDKNLMTNFRQWFQTNVDLKDQKDAYFRERKNVTWNWADPTDLTPIYWDNPYFSRYENFENDTRNRYTGNVSLNYKFASWLNLLGRVSLDAYDELQEERQAVGSVATSDYSRFNHGFRETNFDLLLNFDKNITSNINLKALLGTNIRKQHETSIATATNGGLIVPKIYSLSNSSSTPNAPTEFDGRREVDGIFAGATFSWKDMVTLDGTIRRDVSSTLPKGNNKYYYPSISGGFVFSKLLPSANWLTYGKLRANYAKVGNDAPYYSTLDYYNVFPPFGAAATTSVGGTKSNADLVPEQNKSSEAGLEMAFLKSRLGFDVTYYDAKSFNQILPVTVSTATGYSSKFLNSGTIQNKGIELSAYGTPVQSRNFSWTINVNWTRNRNEVIDLFKDASGNQAENLLLATFQGGISINATLHQPYGTLRGSNFVYTNGERTVKANGRYQITRTSNEVIGNPNPNWIGGVNNTLKYKNFSLSWLVDVRQGGDVFTLDLYYGLATGLYPETAALNDLGKPSRNALADGGGIIMQGVTADGKANTKRVSNANYGTFGYVYNPAAAFIYDASFVKLREALISYSIPKATMDKIRPFKGIDLSLIGRNLWIIHKNLPYADPEEAVSAGNLQGYQSGAYPTTRTLTFNVKLRF